MRTLASIQRITKLEPIPNADAIEKASVLGWNVVVKKGEFKVGDLCCYIEIDSVLPAKPEFEFLAPKYRVKTVRLRGQISQGICFPVSILGIDYPPTHIIEGEDVTGDLGVTKYELPVHPQLAGKVRGNFPGFLPKTDETRIQAYPDVLTKYQDVPFYVAEKLDGSSTTFVVKNEEFHVCSRNLDLLEESGNTIWKVAREMKLEEKLRSLGEERYALQGEIVGEGIQRNTLKIKGQKIYFFNIYDFMEAHYLSYEKFVEVMQMLDLPIVPIISTDYRLPKTVDEIVAYATKKSVINPEAWCEGYVFRPLQEMQDEDLGRLSFKAINPEFLLKNGE